MSVLLIVNPQSAKGRTGTLFPSLLGPVERALGKCEVVMTRAVGDGVERARQGVRQGFDTVIAVGGDGTLSEVANGVLEGQREGVAVGLIPQGTGGDFRRSLGQPQRFDQILAQLKARKVRQVDAGRVEFTGLDGQPAQRTFLNVASYGMGGLVDKYVREAPAGLSGGAAYFIASLRALAGGACLMLDCEIEDEHGEKRTLNVETRNLAVCNGRYFGGGMQIAPRAQLDDGLFDVVATGSQQRLGTVTMAPSLYRGEHLNRKDVTYFRARRLTVRPRVMRDAKNFLLDVDGEYAGSGPVTFTVLPRAVAFIAAV